MISGQRVLALIPARGGSKRLPRKNVRLLNGKPLIGWTIDAARGSRYVDDVFISTDDQEIADAAWEHGIDVPELRCAELASDSATAESVLADVLKRYESKVDIVVLLQPTSPLRTHVHIDEALELFVSKKAHSVASVTQCEHSPLWANTLPEDGSMKNFIRPEALRRSQDLPSYYRLNGAIYAFDAKQFMQNERIQYTSKSFSYVMDNHVSLDIDNQIDFDMAEFFMHKANQNS